MKFPVLYVTSFTAYIVIYHADGTVGVSHGGTEMGQGMNTKIAQVVAYLFGIPLDSITVAPFSSLIAANASLTAATISTEAICMATKKACERILERLKPVREKLPNGSWLEIVKQAFTQDIDLTQKEVFGATEAKPYAIAGCSCAELEVDVLTGNVQILRVDIAEDVGNSMNPLVDVGQIEGEIEFPRRNKEMLILSGNLFFLKRCLHDGGWLLVDRKNRL